MSGVALHNANNSRARSAPCSRLTASSSRGPSVLKVSLEYRFAGEDASDPALVALLTEHGLGTARALVKHYAPRTEETLPFSPQSGERGYKVRSSAALLVDYLRDRAQGK